jgi:hypothetical protein
MSTAILISGQLRTFARCWPTQRWHVLRHFADPHFFICVQAQPDWSQILQPLIDEYGADRVHIDLKGDPDLSSHLTPQLSAAYHLAPYANAAPAQQLLLQHWYQQECWKFFERLTKDDQHMSPSLGEFASIVRLRADLWFHSFKDPKDPFLNPPPRAYVFGSGGNVCYTPWWGRFGGINDRFAIMGPEAAVSYFTVFDQIPSLLASGCPFHPESLVKANLQRGNVHLHETLRTEFSTERLNGERRWWLQEVLPCDRVAA